MTKAMLRIADSLAYVAAARHVYVVVDDAENDKARLFREGQEQPAPGQARPAVRSRNTTRRETIPNRNDEIWAPHVIWDSESMSR